MSCRRWPVSLHRSAPAGRQWRTAHPISSHVAIDCPRTAGGIKPPHPSSDAVFFFFLFSSGGNQTPLSSSDAAFFLSQITLRLVRGQTATKPLMPCPSSTLSCRGVRKVMLSSKGLLPYHMERAGRLCRRHLRSCGRQELSRNQTLIKASASSKMVGNHLCANMLMMPVSPTPAPPERT